MKHPIRLTALLIAVCAALILVPVGTLVIAQDATRTPTRAASPTPRPSTATPAATPTALTFATPVPVAANVLIAQEFTLASLGVRNLEIVSPQGSAQFSFEVPENWVASGNNTLTFNVEFFQSGGGVAKETDKLVSPPVSTLDVRLGNQIIGSVSFREEDSNTARSFTFRLPTDLIMAAPPRRKIISFSLDARDHCESNLLARVFIRSDLSFLHFEYQRAAPSLNLRDFPVPFYNNPLGDQTEVVQFVLPNAYTPADLEAAMSLSAGFGRLTGDQLELKIATESELAPEFRVRNNMIFIGKPQDHQLIRSLYAANLLTTRWTDSGQFTVGNQPVESDEGIVELIANPENSMQAVMVVTGATDAAILKAARAFAGPVRVVGLDGPLALIRNVPPAATTFAGAFEREMRTFAEMGYEQTILFGVGNQFADFRFSLPANTRLKQEAYVNLVFDYSDTMRMSNTTVALLVNEQPIGTLEIDAKRLPAEGPLTLRAPIPPSFVRPGEANSLTVVSSTSGNWGCRLPSPEVAWISVRPESSLSLPSTPVDPKNIAPLVSNFPLPFNAYSDLNDVLVILPDQPANVDLERALRMMSRLGSETTNGAFFRARAAFGPRANDLNLAQYNVILLGRPINNSVLAGLNENLPQKFQPGTDQLIQIAESVEIRLPPGFDIGVIQTLKSPWAAGRFVLVVTGTSNIGESYATNAVLGQTFARSEQVGAVVFVTSNTIFAVATPEWLDISTDVPDLATQTALQGTFAPTQSSANTVTPGPTPTPTITNTPRPTNSPTPLFTPTIDNTTPTPTPLPTLTPLPEAELLPEMPDRPRWLFGLAVVTVVVAIVSIVAGGISIVNFIRRRNKSK
jgi:hypothetical protein